MYKVISGLKSNLLKVFFVVGLMALILISPMGTEQQNLNGCGELRYRAVTSELPHEEEFEVNEEYAVEVAVTLEDILHSRGQRILERNIIAAEREFINSQENEDADCDSSVEMLSYESVYSSLELNEEDLAILYRIVEAEATGGDTDSKIHVTHVVLNRVLSKKFPNTIEGVVFQKKQFSPIIDGRYYSVAITEHTKLAVQAALEMEDTTSGALYFCAMKQVKNENTKSWFNTLVYLFTDSLGHSFYTE